MASTCVYQKIVVPLQRKKKVTTHLYYFYHEKDSFDGSRCAPVRSLQ